jgi:hypothetical protein
MNALTALLRQLRARIPPWARPGLDEVEQLLASLRGLRAGTAAAVLACAVLLYAAKAFLLASIGVFLAVHALMGKFTAPTPEPGSDAPEAPASIRPAG